MNCEKAPPLEQTDLARLDQFLSSQACGGSAISLTFAHGFLTSIACGPEQLEPAEWLHLMFDEPVFEDGSQSDDMLGMVVRLYTDVEYSLRQNSGFRPVLEFINEDGQETRVDAQRWSLGFVRGLSLFQGLWTQQAKETLAEPLLALFELAEIRGSAAPAYQELCGLIPEIAHATFAYWENNKS